MAFKFKCEHCGEELTVFYLKIGEEAQCTACSRQATVPETAERFDSPKRIPQPRISLPVKQDEERRRELTRERTREEIIRTPSVRAVKWALDVVWYGGFVFFALTIIGEIVLGPNGSFYSDPSLELPVRVYYVESPDLLPLGWCDGSDPADFTDRAEGMVLLGHDYSVYQMPGGTWPPSVVVDMVLRAVFIMTAAYFLRRTFRSIIGGNPFSKQNSVDLRIVGFVIAAWGPVYGAYSFLRGAYYLPWLGMENAITSVELHLYPKLIIVGLVIIAMAHLFELAARIQREQDLTI